ncbi:MAG: hypothetical protein PWP46_2044 [Fusobacteriaceae bacterium]|jgi:hypothetical protein|nr:hypothetical protein [Fusobacteriales bacterium]MDN5305158.1 hypothetical protein [Fusobacteriaceae bacterium]
MKELQLNGITELNEQEMMNIDGGKQMAAGTNGKIGGHYIKRALKAFRHEVYKAYCNAHSPIGYLGD